MKPLDEPFILFAPKILTFNPYTVHPDVPDL